MGGKPDPRFTGAVLRVRTVRFGNRARVCPLPGFGTSKVPLGSAYAIRSTLVEADRRQIVRPCIGDGRVVVVGEQDGLAAGGQKREEAHAGLEPRRLREEPRDLVGLDRLHVSHLPHAQGRQLGHIEDRLGMILDIEVHGHLLDADAVTPCPTR